MKLRWYLRLCKYTTEESDDMTAKESYERLRYQMVRWANLNPDDTEKYSLHGAFSYMLPESQRQAALHLFSGAMLVADELYAMNKPNE